MNIKHFKLDYGNKKMKATIKLVHFILLSFILTLNVKVLGQENKLVLNTNNVSTHQQADKVISYNEKIAFGNVESSAVWTINFKKNNNIVHLKGNEINDYVFINPGIYEINFLDNKKHDEHECNHSQFKEKMIIEVSPLKMTFDFSQITFSQPIQKGKNCDGIIISVPVNVTMIENNPTKFVVSNAVVAGIGTDLIAQPTEKEVTIKNGLQILKYKLSGTVNNETYLMFDFVDYNNQVQTFNLLEIIK